MKPIKVISSRSLLKPKLLKVSEQYPFYHATLLIRAANKKKALE